MKKNEALTTIIKHTASAGLNPQSVLDVILFETAGTLDPAIKNYAGSGATGLIQFMPKTAVSLGTTVAELSKMTVSQQMFYVIKYFNQYKTLLKNHPNDYYFAVLYPALIGKPDNSVFASKAKTQLRYTQNFGLDLNRNTLITKDEIRKKFETVVNKHREKLTIPKITQNQSTELKQLPLFLIPLLFISILIFK